MTDEIRGIVERITFQNEDNGYTVAKLKEPKKRELTCIVGTLPLLRAGESVRCLGQWQRHMVFGQQFVVSNCELEAPATVLGIQKYLGSGLIKGIGPVYAARIVKKFGLQTLEVIEDNPKSLFAIEGMGKKRVNQIIDSWKEQRLIREVMLFLQTHGISPSFSQKIYKTYGDNSLRVLRDNPYSLARDIHGIGFKKADEVAAKLGIPKDSSIRIDAGIEYVLWQLSGDGHVCYPREELLQAACEILEVEAIDERLESLVASERLASAAGLIWIRSLFIYEMGVAKELHRLRKGVSTLRSIDTEKAVSWAEQQLGIELADRQRLAVAMALTEKIHIITGGPGTGKSTITNAILHISSKLTGSILLAAPTGRAAKRMSEITHRPASTIHSMLEFDFKKMGFKKDRKNPLECDLLIVDEASMIDTALMCQLLRAVASHTRVIFVGDIDQLPSVGPGNVLKDLIGSKIVPVTTLDEIFRQAKGSKIVTYAHDINAGKIPTLENGPKDDFFFVECIDPESGQQDILNLVATRLPKKYGLNSLRDIQVLAPMRRGVLGIESLNITLQEKLNKRSEGYVRGGMRYQIGDKVMQIRNNYQKEVFNGDVGFIEQLDYEAQECLINFDGKCVGYGFSEFDEIVLAYAVSIHKYQGSECPCVVIPIHTSHYKMLHRNLLYTGITRGKKLVVIVGTQKAFRLAILNNEVQQRHTGLKEALWGKI